MPKDGATLVILLVTIVGGCIGWSIANSILANITVSRSSIMHLGQWNLVAAYGAAAFGAFIAYRMIKKVV